MLNICNILLSRDIPCPYCTRTYSAWNSLYKHSRREHETASNSEQQVFGELNLSHLQSSSHPELNVNEPQSSQPELNINEPQSSSQPEIPQQSAAGLSDNQSLERVLLQIAGKYYGNNALTRKMAGLFFRDFERVMTASYYPVIVKHFRTAGLSAESEDQGLELIQSVFRHYSSEFRILAHFRNKNTLIDAIPYTVGTRFDYVTRKQGKTYQSVDCVAHRIPLRQVFYKLFSMTNVLSSTLSYMKRCYADVSGTMENFIQGSAWRKRIANAPDKLIIPYFLFFDDFESGNALGSHSGIHKLGAVYIAFPCLAINFPSGTSVSQSSLNKIILAALFHSSDRSEFGNYDIFKPIIDDMNDLKLNGINFHQPGIDRTIYFELGLILGDNLGIHSICGFVESFSANRCCRTCRIEKNDLRKDTEENPELLRNVSNYREDLDSDTPVTAGVKEKCVFFHWESFNVFDQIGIDIFHDIFEGCGKYVMGFLLKVFILDEQYFSLDNFNSRLQQFDFGPDNSAKPVAMSIDGIRKKIVRQSASGLANLIRYFGLLIGDLVPMDDERWALYESLVDLVREVTRWTCCTETAEYISVLVSELNAMYMELSGGHLQPKFHFMVHYPRALLAYGPLALLSSMRFESKHRVLKNAANVSANRRNITLTLALKHQLVLNELFIDGAYRDPLKLTFSSKEFKLPDYELLLSSLGIPVNEMSGSVVKAASFYNHCYRTGTVLQLNTNDCSDFIRITEMLHIKMKLIFVGVVLENLGYSRKYMSYGVQVSPITLAVFHCSFKCPYPCTLSTAIDGSLFVTKR